MKTLVEYLIDNCCDIFGEDNSLLFSISDEDSLDHSGTVAYRYTIFIEGLFKSLDQINHSFGRINVLRYATISLEVPSHYTKTLIHSYNGIYLDIY